MPLVQVRLRVVAVEIAGRDGIVIAEAEIPGAHLAGGEHCGADLEAVARGLRARGRGQNACGKAGQGQV